ncbi:MAG: hypothetical protein M1833_004377 [Piccolia ochrophora]|nr:MAG: hypothetical protein M1833_004377 [Piccolia ochrophora]
MRRQTLSAVVHLPTRPSVVVNPTTASPLYASRRSRTRNSSSPHPQPPSHLPLPTFRHYLRHQTTSAAPSPSASTAPPQTTYYTLFPTTLPHGPPPHGPFPVPLSALKTEYLRLQRTTHPDAQPAAQKARYEALSAHLGVAYRTLADPLLRGEYLLSLRGVGTEGEAEGTEGVEQDVLGTVLGAREVLELARGEEEVVEVGRENEERIERSEEVLGRAFEEDDLERARREVVRLRYWVGIRQAVAGWEAGKGGGVLHH